MINCDIYESALYQKIQLLLYAKSFQPWGQERKAATPAGRAAAEDHLKGGFTPFEEAEALPAESVRLQRMPPIAA
ncbi:hypothetical protein [Salibacterium sp. K-3]